MIGDLGLFLNGQRRTPADHLLDFRLPLRLGKPLRFDHRGGVTDQTILTHHVLDANEGLVLVVRIRLGDWGSRRAGNTVRPRPIAAIHRSF